jgi:uncharacterized protein YggU (UPF0235/DUF167 family)
MSVPDDAFVAETTERPSIRIRVRPRSRRRVIEAGSDRLIVGVGAPAEGGRATSEALATLAVWLGVKRSEVQLARGAASRDKRVVVSGHTASDLRKRIRSRLSS